MVHIGITTWGAIKNLTDDEMHPGFHDWVLEVAPLYGIKDSDKCEIKAIPKGEVGHFFAQKYPERQESEESPPPVEGLATMQYVDINLESIDINEGTFQCNATNDTCDCACTIHYENTGRKMPTCRFGEYYHFKWVKVD
jgi:hypothetical protein